jgi:hypothetical protein
MVLPRRKWSRFVVVAAVITLFAVLGAQILTWSSSAATSSVSVEAEAGVKTGVVSDIADSSASSGSGVVFGRTVPSGEQYLPMLLPSQDVLKSSPKKVFAHYFTQFPISIDNKPAESDYYAVNYLNPNGESGKHSSYGGFLRERPLPRPVIAAADWRLEDMKTEVRRATGAGLDGFTLDMLSLSGAHWDKMQLLLQAATAVDPKFKILLMPDGTTSVTADVNALANSVAGMAQNSSAYRLADGRLVISPFAPERQGAAWWQNWLAIMKSKGIDVAFVPCFVDYRNNVESFAPFSYGLSNWGSRSPAANANIATNITDAHNRGKLWMQSASTQDERPRSGVYDEAQNSENYRLTWDGAIRGDAEWVQIPTWNDYTESAEIAPSTHIGWSLLDLTSYYVTKYKLGVEPTIRKDVVYVSHRVHPAAATPTGGQTRLMLLRAGSSQPRDMVEALTFLTAPAKVSVKIGATAYTYDAPAGVYAKTYPLAAGTVSVSTTRITTGQVTATATSTFPVTNSPVVQDLQYYFTSSAR